MYRKLMLALVLMTSAAWLQAQAGYGQSGANQNTSGQTTIQGCLQGSNGSYTLTADNGTTYQLSGDTSKLSDHVGHEVKITGTTSEPSASSTPSSTGASPATLEVKSMKHVATSCKSK